MVGKSKANLEKGMDILRLALLSDVNFSETNLLRIVHGTRLVENMLKTKRIEFIIGKLAVVYSELSKDPNSRRFNKEVRRALNYHLHTAISNWSEYMQKEFPCKIKKNKFKVMSKYRLILSYIKKDPKPFFFYDETMSFFHGLEHTPSFNGFINLSLLLHIYVYSNKKRILKQWRSFYQHFGEEQFWDPTEKRVREHRKFKREYHDIRKTLVLFHKLNIERLIIEKEYNFAKWGQTKDTPPKELLSLIYNTVYKDIIKQLLAPTTDKVKRVEILQKLFS